jgi:hypothetical protein
MGAALDGEGRAKAMATLSADKSSEKRIFLPSAIICSGPGGPETDSHEIDMPDGTAMWKEGEPNLQ